MDVHEGMFIALLLMAVWNLSRGVKFGGSVAVEMRGMLHFLVLKSAEMLSVVDCVCILILDLNCGLIC